MIKLQAAIYYNNYIKKQTKRRVIENSELHFISENLIKIITSKDVVMGVRYQLQSTLEEALSLDSGRGTQGQ